MAVKTERERLIKDGTVQWKLKINEQLYILTENHTHTKYIGRHCVTKDLPVYIRQNNTTAHCTCSLQHMKGTHLSPPLQAIIKSIILYSSGLAKCVFQDYFNVITQNSMTCFNYHLNGVLWCQHVFPVDNRTETASSKAKNSQLWYAISWLDQKR